jgi:hypothetical protein
MQKRISTHHITLCAKTVGFSLILMAVIAGIGYGYAFDTLYTDLEILDAHSINALLRVTAASFLLLVLLDIIVAWVLYYLFKKENRALSLLIA